MFQRRTVFVNEVGVAYLLVVVETREGAVQAHNVVILVGPSALTHCLLEATYLLVKMCVNCI